MRMVKVELKRLEAKETLNLDLDLEFPRRLEDNEIAAHEIFSMLGELSFYENKIELKNYLLHVEAKLRSVEAEIHIEEEDGWYYDYYITIFRPTKMFNFYFVVLREVWSDGPTFHHVDCYTELSRFRETLKETIENDEIAKQIIVKAEKWLKGEK
jgi:hypothetical protein